MQTRGVVGVWLTLVLLAGCTGAPQTPAPTGAVSPAASTVADLVDGDQLRPESVEALRTRFSAVPRAAQDQELADIDLAVERQLWSLSGLEAALGGAQQADDLFARTNTAIRAELDAASGTVTARVKIGRKGVVLPADSLSEANGAALMGGLIIAGISASSAANMVDGKANGSAPPEKGITRSVTQTTGTIEVHSSTTVEGVEVRMDTKATVQPCPDASGRVVASVTASGSTHQGATGMRYSYHVDVTVQVGDDAQIIDQTQAFRTEQSEYSPSGRRFLDIAYGADGTSSVKRAVGDLPDDFVRNTATGGVVMGMTLAAMATDGAKEKWLSGACVVLKPTVSEGPSGLRPGAQVKITAAPRASVDGASTGGTVTAQMAGGEGSVDPSGTKVPADATFIYTAPTEPQKTGTVSLESRSKRGVGKASIRFDTYPLSFSADGGAAEFHGTGTICDLRKPFVIAGTGLKLDFTPSGTSGGSYKLSGRAGGVAWSGGGSYTVAINEAGTSGKLVASGVNTISTPKGTFSDSAVAKFTLRSIAPCGS